MPIKKQDKKKKKNTIDKTLLKDLLKESKASREWILNVRKAEIILLTQEKDTNHIKVTFPCRLLVLPPLLMVSSLFTTLLIRVDPSAPPSPPPPGFETICVLLLITPN